MRALFARAGSKRVRRLIIKVRIPCRAVSEWASLPSDSRADQHARSRAAGDGAADDRPSGRRVRIARPRSAGGPEGTLPDDGTGGDLSGLGKRRVGSVARQHALARRPGPDLRHRGVREGLGGGRAAPGTRRRGHAGDLAERRRSGGARSQAARRPRACPPRRPGRAQRDLHRRHEPAARNSARDRSRRSPGPVARRRGVVAGLDRAPARRVGARRDAGRISKRADAAAGPELQRHQREGAGRVALGPPAAILLGVGAHAGAQCIRVLPVHAGDEPAVRPARSARDAERGRARTGVQAARAPRRGRACRRAGLGPRHRVRAR